MEREHKIAHRESFQPPGSSNSALQPVGGPSDINQYSQPAPPNTERELHERAVRRLRKLHALSQGLKPRLPPVDENHHARKISPLPPPSPPSLPSAPTDTPDAGSTPKPYNQPFPKDQPNDHRDTICLPEDRKATLQYCARAVGQLCASVRFPTSNDDALKSPIEPISEGPSRQPRRELRALAPKPPRPARPPTPPSIAMNIPPPPKATPVGGRGPHANPPPSFVPNNHTQPPIPGHTPPPPFGSPTRPILITITFPWNLPPQLARHATIINNIPLPRHNPAQFPLLAPPPPLDSRLRNRYAPLSFPGSIVDPGMGLWVTVFGQVVSPLVTLPPNCAGVHTDVAVGLIQKYVRSELANAGMKPLPMPDVLAALIAKEKAAGQYAAGPAANTNTWPVFIPSTGFGPGPMGPVPMGFDYQVPYHLLPPAPSDIELDYIRPMEEELRHVAIARAQPAPVPGANPNAQPAPVPIANSVPRAAPVPAAKPNPKAARLSRTRVLSKTQNAFHLAEMKRKHAQLSRPAGVRPGTMGVVRRAPHPLPPTKPLLKTAKENELASTKRKHAQLSQPTVIRSEALGSGQSLPHTLPPTKPLLNITKDNKLPSIKSKHEQLSQLAIVKPGTIRSVQKPPLTLPSLRSLPEHASGNELASLKRKHEQLFHPTAIRSDTMGSGQMAPPTLPPLGPLLKIMTEHDIESRKAKYMNQLWRAQLGAMSFGPRTLPHPLLIEPVQTNLKRSEYDAAVIERLGVRLQTQGLDALHRDCDRDERGRRDSVLRSEGADGNARGDGGSGVSLTTAGGDDGDARLAGQKRKRGGSEGRSEGGDNAKSRRTS